MSPDYLLTSYYYRRISLFCLAFQLYPSTGRSFLAVVVRVAAAVNESDEFLWNCLNCCRVLYGNKKLVDCMENNEPVTRTCNLNMSNIICVSHKWFRQVRQNSFENWCTIMYRIWTSFKIQWKTVVNFRF